MAPRYVPTRGDVVWLELSPQAGHEQAGRRPAVVVSPAAYNRKAGLALLCPITSQIKGYPFEVSLPSDLDVSGVVLSDQIKSLDWRARKARRFAELPSEVMSEILGKLQALVS
jgi:mRNA interferase MazF